MNTTCCIIVTYNRKNLFLRCVEAVIGQTSKPIALFVVDNACTDGTKEEFTKKYNLLNPSDDEYCFIGNIADVECYYYRSTENRGGAGGFSLGLRLAHQQNKYDAFWMMDDDGYPTENCLEKLLPYVNEHNYVMPVSIDIENREKLSWPVVLKNGGKTTDYKQLKNDWGEIMNYVYPFNGSLLSKKIVDEVGYINENLFIWGDEYEHYWRCKSKGYNPITITAAQFYHPANKMNFVPILFGLVKVPFSDSKLRMVCLARNYTYIYWNYNQKHKILLKFVAYSWLFIITRKFDLDGYKLYILSVIDGLRKNFTRHKQFLNR